MAENPKKGCENCVKIVAVEDKKNIFKCQICFEIVTKRYGAIRHCHNKHCGQVFACTKCHVFKFYKSVSALENHNISVHGDGLIEYVPLLLIYLTGVYFSPTPTPQ
jgi:hypothetical protein